MRKIIDLVIEGLTLHMQKLTKELEEFTNSNYQRGYSEGFHDGMEWQKGIDNDDDPR